MDREANAEPVPLATHIHEYPAIWRCAKLLIIASSAWRAEDEYTRDGQNPEQVSTVSDHRRASLENGSQARSI